MITVPQGFRFASTYAGIRKVRKDDLTLIVSTPPASAAAVFTRNRAAAAPVVLGRKHLAASKGRVAAIIVNAGNANCATRGGVKAALASCRAVARQLRVPLTQVLPSSTGVIGVELDESLIVNAVPALAAALTPDGFLAAAEAIMTTDLVRKIATAEVAMPGGIVRIAGMTKGSGMIQPMMATTLGFIMTDAAIPTLQLGKMLRRVADASYNRISVDGDTSTNDTLALLANGASRIAPQGRDLRFFEEVLTRIAQDLAIQIARDGEGAKKLVTIRVTGAANDGVAATIARSIANSPLVKTAIAGSDPNWGRILSAAGNSGVNFDPRKTDISLQSTLVCKGGLAAPFSESELKQKLDGKECVIEFRIRGGGEGTARFWTCDLTEDYIRINASYRT